MAKDAQTLPLLEVSEQTRARYQEQASKCPTPFLYQALRLMNQCDINYRQSSNKRLLVELTLIEVAQITQPADASDTPGSGRKPRRLKSLFKQLIQQPKPQTVASQVATAKPAASTTQPVGLPTESVSTSTKPVSTPVPSVAEPSAPSAPKPVVKISAFGTSWNQLRNNGTAPKMTILPGTTGTDDRKENEHQTFTQQELELQWMAMCNRMPQKLVGIAARMKNMNPVITTIPHVEVVVSNDLIKSEMANIHGSIVNTLKLYLHNSDITLTVNVAEQQVQEKVLTRRELFEEMVKSNPSVEKLRDVFELELA